MQIKDIGKKRVVLPRGATELELPNGTRIISCNGVTDRDLETIMRYLRER